MIREGCIRCDRDGDGHPDGHFLPLLGGGKAACPTNDFHDPTIREEMMWVAIEEALQDAGWNLPAAQDVRWHVQDSLPQVLLHLGAPGGFHLPLGGIRLHLTSRDVPTVDELDPTVEIVAQLIAQEPLCV